MINKEDIYIKSFDNLLLKSRKIVNEKPSNTWVIAVHGYAGEGIQMGTFAQKFYDMGYNILIPDARGLGGSEGDYIGMGWHDRLDIVSWIDYLVSKYSDSQIILYGISMGEQQL